MLHKAVFLNLRSIITKLPPAIAEGNDYDNTDISPLSIEFDNWQKDVIINDVAIDALKQLPLSSGFHTDPSHFHVFFVSNQPCITRGVITKSDMDAVMSHVRTLLYRSGIDPSGVYFCPHHPDNGCVCRLSQPGMLWTAMTLYNIDPAQSWVISDTMTEIFAGQRAKIPEPHLVMIHPKLLINTGYGVGEVVRNLLGAVKIILDKR